MAKKRNIVVVGAGLFGSMAATLARANGYSVTVIDSGAAWAASKASGCVLAPSWLSSLSAEQREQGLLTLRSLYPVHPVAFRTPLGGVFNAERVALKDVLVAPDETAQVVHVGDGYVVLGTGRRLTGDVLVAAGCGSGDLVYMPPIKPLWGASAVFSHKLVEPRIAPYAPYKQAVAFAQSPGRTWFGDGATLSEVTWAFQYQEREAALVQRAADLFDISGKATITSGARPSVVGHKAGYFAQVHEHTWVSTGGAKNGTVLAALQAALFVREISA